MSSFVIGIAGGSGSGKTTICNGLIELLPPGSVLLLQHDSYYRDLRSLTFAERAAQNFDHPDALDTALCAMHLRALRRGEPVRQPLYDFATHLRKEETLLTQPRPIILLDGILIFTDEELREEMDLRIFVEAAEEICLHRRLERDVVHRGRSAESVLEQYHGSVKPMFDRYVGPSRQYADFILRSEGDTGRAVRFLAAALRALL